VRCLRLSCQDMGTDPAVWDATRWALTRCQVICTSHPQGITKRSRAAEVMVNLSHVSQGHSVVCIYNGCQLV
jgi:hypothetical protein